MKKTVIPVLIFFVIFSLVSVQKLSSSWIEVPWTVLFGEQMNFFSSAGSTDVIVSGSGDVYTTGYSSGWNPSLFGAPILDPNDDSGDIYVAKWNSKGKLLWHTFLGSGRYDYSEAIDLDREGNIYITGSSPNAWDTNKYGFPINNYNPDWSDDVVVAKLSPDGQLIWYTFLGGSSNEYGYEVKVSGSGDIYISGNGYGEWNSLIYGGPVTAYNTDYTYYNNSDIFVAKLNTAGALQWYTFLGSGNYDWTYGLTVIPGEHIYVLGMSEITWNEAKYGVPLTQMSSTDFGDGLIARLDPDGNFEWYTFIGEKLRSVPAAMDFIPGVGLYLAGLSDTFSVSNGVPASARSFMTDLRGKRNLVAPLEMFTASFSFTGTKKWIKTHTIGDWSIPESMDVGPLDDIYISGFTMSGIPDIFASNSGANKLEPFTVNVFVMKQEPNGYVDWIYKFDKSSYGSASGISADDKGVLYVTGMNFFFAAIAPGGLAAIDPFDFYQQLFLVKMNEILSVEVKVMTGGGNVEKEVFGVVPGESCAINIYPDPGYEISGIIDNGKNMPIANPYVLSGVSEDHIVEISFRIIKYPPELLLTGMKNSDTAWIIKTEFADLTITIIEHSSSPMDVHAYVLYKYMNGEWMELTRYTEPGTYSLRDRFSKGEEAGMYILRAVAADGSVIAESDILIL